jgi:hypothetical protein
MIKGKDIILTGPPRSGTTLACFLLNKLPHTIALHEPMRLSMFTSPEEGLSSVQAFFPEMRQSLQKEGKALSRISKNEIPDNPFPQDRSGLRKSIVRKDWVTFHKPLQDGFDLILKHNAHFTFTLAQLMPHYPCYALIRHPVAVIASWNTIDAPVAEGRLNVLPGLRPDLHARLTQISDTLERQVMLLHYLFEAYAPLPETTIIRYEDLVRSGGRALSAITPRAEALDEQLENKNRSNLYDAAKTEAIKSRLLALDGAYLRYYPADVIASY